MDREQARKRLKGSLRSYVESITTRSAGNMYVCPLCKSGTGEHRTGAFSIDGDFWKCFSCGECGDIFDLIGKVEGVTGYSDQLRRAGELYGITLDGPSNIAEGSPAPSMENQKKPEAEQADYTDFFLQANKNITKTNYHRGLSLETLNRFKVGFVENWQHPKPLAEGKNPPPRPSLILPTSKSSYLSRDTRENLSETQERYKKMKVGGVHMFNIEALQKSKKPVFIVEGELDALSIIDVGGEAVALGSTNKAKDLLELLKAQKPTQPLILALDNDEHGDKASKELSEGLAKLGFSFYRFNPCGKYKDANEALQKDREALRAAVEEAEHLQDEAEQARREYLKNSTAHYIQGFIDGIADGVNTPCISTCFPALDSALDGGLYEGLYVVGAISSLGKTTFVLQMADQIAQSGHYILIFSLEMARAELMAKSISRHTLLNVLAEGGDMRNAKTARGITSGKRYENYNEAEQGLIKKSITDYSKYADRIYISEGIGDIGAEQVRETVAKHILFTGKTPVVIVDYVQILAPADIRGTDKQNMDKAVLELKRISRDFKIPVICISSLNRANYNTPISFEAFKESGGLEYGSDVVIGLQLKGTGGKNFDANEAKSKNPRSIELVILKNRNFCTGAKVPFDYYPMFNYFAEAYA